MKVLQVLLWHSERKRIMCPLGVRYAAGQVSLMQMSRRSVHIPSLKEVNLCRTLVRRVHQGPRGNEDNPPPAQILLDIKTAQEYTSRKGPKDAHWIGSYIYFIIILSGLVIQDQQDRARYQYGYNARCCTKLMVMKLICFGWEWLHLSSLHLLRLCMGAALVVPTTMEPVAYTHKVMRRMAGMSILACWWIQRQLQGLHSKCIYAIPGWLCNLGGSAKERQRSSRLGRGGRQHSTSRDHGRNNRAPPTNRSSEHEHHGGSAARHYSNLGGRTPIGIVGRRTAYIRR
jgi:hypothetical protein